MPQFMSPLKLHYNHHDAFSLDTFAIVFVSDFYPLRIIFTVT